MHTLRTPALVAVVVLLATLGAATPALGQQATIATNSEVLRIGQPVHGSFTNGDQTDQGRRRDVFTYDARADEVVNFEFEGSGTQVALYVSGPGDLDEKYFWTPRGELAVRFPVAGVYRVIAESDGSREGSYTLTLTGGSAAATAMPVGRITIGETVRAGLQPGGPINRDNHPTNVHTIDAQRGQRVAAIVSPCCLFRLRLIGPDGGEVRARAGASTDGLMTSLEADISVAGQYRLEVSNPSDTAEYTLRLLSEAEGATLMANANATAARERADRQARVAYLQQRGEQLVNSGADAEAITVYGELLSLDAQNVAAMVNRGGARYRQGDYSLAAHDFSSALIYDPSNQLARQNLQAAEVAQRAEQAEVQRQIAQGEIDRQQRDAAAIGNAIGTFTGAYTATIEAQRQADAQARAQADAQAAANARAARHASSSGSAGGSQSGSSGANAGGESGGTRTYVDAQGRPCVYLVDQRTRSLAVYNDHILVLGNRCSSNISVMLTEVDQTTGAQEERGAVAYANNLSNEYSCLEGLRGAPPGCRGFSSWRMIVR